MKRCFEYLLLVAWGLGLLVAVSACSSGGEKVTLQSMMRSMTGPSAKELVAWAFDPNDPDRRREGVIGLSSRDWGLKEPYLKGYAALLKTDKDPLVRAAAVSALGRAGDPKYAPDVTRGLLDHDSAVRHDAATALDRVYDANSAKFLRNRALNDVDQDVRAKCCRALRNHPDVSTVRVLSECLGDKEFSVRHQAHASLVSIVGRDLGHDSRNWQDVAAGRALPPKPPVKAKRPWWDWMGVTKGDDRPAAAPEPEPTPPPETTTPPTPAKRPWWDWMGVTQSSPKNEPADADNASPEATK